MELCNLVTYELVASNTRNNALSHTKLDLSTHSFAQLGKGI